MPSTLPPQKGEREQTEPLPSDVVEGIRRELEQRSRMSLIIYHPDGAEMVLLFHDVPVIVGREQPADVRINDATLSREHARFTLTGGKVVVEDLDSTNGTWLAGQPVRTADVGPGDEVILGGLMACLHTLGPSETNIGLESHERFLVRIEEEVVRAQHFGERFAVLMVRAEDPSVHVGRWSPPIRGLLRPVDRIALYSPDAVQILMPDTRDEAVQELARSIVAKRKPGEPAVLVGVATYPSSATAADKLIELSREAAAAATRERPIELSPTTRWLASEAPASRRAGRDLTEGMIAGRAMRDVLETVARLRDSKIPVVLHGETGTGKEVLARLIHEGGPRRESPMVCVNSGAIVPNLVESFLFGHEKGAFTGANQQQKGIFEEADGGTVFLDEIGELPLPAQAALLRVLETKRITRVGSNREITVDVRIVAATHRDLDAMCLKGSFRDDLYYRLNTMVLTIPPLRDRLDEIEPLAMRFLRDANEANRREVRGIDPEALALLRNYRWPGNVRELKNAIERAVVIARAEVIREADLPARVRAAGGVARGSATSPRIDVQTLIDPEIEGAISSRPGQARNLKARLQHYETQLILSTLRSTRWNQTEAARQLGMPLRTLVHKIKVLGIKRL